MIPKLPNVSGFKFYYLIFFVFLLLVILIGAVVLLSPLLLIVFMIVRFSRQTSKDQDDKEGGFVQCEKKEIEPLSMMWQEYCKKNEK